MSKSLYDTPIVQCSQPYFYPSKKFCLGSGSYADVYLGLKNSSDKTNNDDNHHDNMNTQNLCVVKLFFSGQDCKRACFKEVRLLKSLEKSPIVESFGIVTANDDDSDDRINNNNNNNNNNNKNNGRAQGGGHSRSTSASLTEKIESSTTTTANTSATSNNNFNNNNNSSNYNNPTCARRAASLSDRKRHLNQQHTSQRSTSFSTRPILLLEYCVGGSLDRFVSEHSYLFDRGLFFKFAIQITRAIEFCHSKNVVHADIKPQNILVTSDLDIKLCDFSKSVYLPLGYSAPPHDPVGLGTLAYSPPEFSRPPPSPFGFPADIFSLSLTLCFILTGIEPYIDVRNTIQLLQYVSRARFWIWHQDYRSSKQRAALQQQLTSPLSASSPRLNIPPSPSAPPLTSPEHLQRPNSSLSTYSDQYNTQYFLAFSPNSQAENMSPTKANQHANQLLSPQFSSSNDNSPNNNINNNSNNNNNNTSPIFRKFSPNDSISRTMSLSRASIYHSQPRSQHNPELDPKLDQIANLQKIASSKLNNNISRHYRFIQEKSLVQQQQQYQHIEKGEVQDSENINNKQGNNGKRPPPLQLISSTMSEDRPPDDQIVGDDLRDLLESMCQADAHSRPVIKSVLNNLLKFQ